MMTIRLMAVALTVTLMCSCGDDATLKPKSGGSPYEVLLMADDDMLAKTVDSILTADMDGLPQSESLFDVSQAKALNQSTRYARCIVTVKRNEALKKPRIRYEKNVYAQPQLMVDLQTPTAMRLNDVAGILTELIVRFELNACAESLSHHRNTKACNEVERMFGWRMLVPEDLSAMKRGRDFLWMSDNGNLSMGNICVYTYKGLTLDANTLLDKRDSVMAANIQGETPQMHMATERRFPPVCRMKHERGWQMLECRGLWQMEGDAMGGPMVCVATVDSANRRVVVAEAFVFAPGRKKRDKLRRLEGALYTLKKQQR